MQSILIKLLFPPEMRPDGRIISATTVGADIIRPKAFPFGEGGPLAVDEAP